MTTNEHEGTDVQSIALYDDGFAWEAIVRVRGVAYVARYVAGRLSVDAAPGRRRAARAALARRSRARVVDGEGSAPAAKLASPARGDARDSSRA